MLTSRAGASLQITPSGRVEPPPMVVESLLLGRRQLESIQSKDPAAKHRPWWQVPRFACDALEHCDRVECHHGQTTE